MGWTQAFRDINAAQRTRDARRTRRAVQQQVDLAQWQAQQQAAQAHQAAVHAQQQEAARQQAAAAAEHRWQWERWQRQLVAHWVRACPQDAAAPHPQAWASYLAWCAQQPPGAALTEPDFAHERNLYR